MKAGNKAALALLALSLLSMLFLSGCTSNKYVPCCVKDEVFDETGAALGNPECIFQNGSAFSTVSDCLVDPTTNSVIFCANGTSCNQISNQDNCEKTSSCLWNESRAIKCTGAEARWALPVCTDRVPKSCVNDRCSAMVCGYTELRPAPPPASQDWDANKSKAKFEESTANLPDAIPANDMQLPSIGLQGTTCDFKTMNQKLYNKMKSARGALWVNSFRFGVGNSFADYEAARNFFPATDRVCASNPSAKVDRFTVYLNAPLFCQPVSTYYTCTKGGAPYLPGLAFWDETTCQLYCGAGVSPFACVSASGPDKYQCNQDGFVYANQSTCKQKCSIIDNPNACANNESNFPFLNTDSSDQARYRMKYVSDYMVDNNNPKSESSAPCSYLAGPTGEVAYPFWRVGEEGTVEAIRCDDFEKGSNGWVSGPWWNTLNMNITGDGSINQLGELRTYFDNRAYSSLDFDYDYYVKNLLGQYTVFDQNGRLPFECETGSDCMSGACDNTHYKRGMCMNASTNLSMACYCSSKIFNQDGGSQTPYPSCMLFDDASAMIVANTGIATEDGISTNPVIARFGNNAPMFYPDYSHHTNVGGGPYAPTTSFEFYAPAGDGTGPKPKLLDLCQVSPKDDNGNPTASPVWRCVMHDKYYDEGTDKFLTTDEEVIFAPEGGLCKYSCADVYPEKTLCTSTNGPKKYWKYNFNLNFPDPTKLGICKLNGKNESGTLTNSSAPYLVLKDLGWCAGCTYATLAVQKVSWGAPENPGGVGAPRQYSCYEYRGDFNYVPGEYPYGGWVNETPGQRPNFIGQIRLDGLSTPSTQPVRITSNPSAYEYDYDGNIHQGPNGDGFYTYVCDDMWHANGGWWPPSEIPTPSAPYLKEKLTSYLQSSVIPILDEIYSVTSVGAGSPYICSSPPSTVYRCCATPSECKNGYYTSDDGCHQNQCGWPYDCAPLPPGHSGYSDPSVCSRDGIMYSTSGECLGACLCNKKDGEEAYYCAGGDGTVTYPTASACAESCGRLPTVYPPESICNIYGGDGAVLHVIGTTAMLSDGHFGGAGSVVVGAISPSVRQYIGFDGMSDSAQYIFSSSAADGKKAMLVRTDFLKNHCETPPLVGLEILPSEDAASLIGTAASPGKLHNFFFDPSQPGPSYEQRVARALPDKPTDEVDLLMQDWYPTCQVPGIPGLLPGEKEVYEIEKRMDFSRALLANFSKPSLIWKFAFPSNSICNQTFFLDYLFNNTALMVDSGITGIIYSDWSAKDGLGYGPEETAYADTYNYGPNRVHTFTGTLNTGLTLEGTAMRSSPAVRTYALDDISTGKGSLFCALESFSKRAIGFMPLTYGQKIYAENQTCYCSPCTDYDYMTGTCSLEALQEEDPDLATPQLYCNDATLCTMPAGENAFKYRYKCEPRCMNYTACKLCNSQFYDTSASFCRISEPGAPATGYSKPYANISDIYWVFVAGLSPSEKCCLESSSEGQEGSRYTYVTLTGSKQQAEFLQFPRRGEFDIDCGRAPDTSVLSYCNIRIPLSQKEIACMRIDKAGTAPAVCGTPDLEAGACNSLGGSQYIGSCASLNSNEGCCNAVAGCHWDSGTCAATEPNPYVICENFNDNPAACNNFGFPPLRHCNWVSGPAAPVCGEPGSGAGTCSSGSHLINSCNNLVTEGCCSSVTQCMWDGAACVGTGSDPQVNCNEFDDNPSGCDTFASPISSCKWIPD